MDRNFFACKKLHTRQFFAGILESIYTAPRKEHNVFCGIFQNIFKNRHDICLDKDLSKLLFDFF